MSRMRNHFVSSTCQTWRMETASRKAMVIALKRAVIRMRGDMINCALRQWRTEGARIGKQVQSLQSALFKMNRSKMTAAWDTWNARHKTLRTEILKVAGCGCSCIPGAEAVASCRRETETSTTNIYTETSTTNIYTTNICTTNI